MFRVGIKDTSGNGKHKTVLITHFDKEGNSMRICSIVLPESLTEEFVSHFKEDE